MGSNSSDMSDSRKSGGAYSGAATGVVQHWLLRWPNALEQDLQPLLP